MASEPPKTVSIWRFDQTPPEFRELFPEGVDADWVAYVPCAERDTLEPMLQRWQGVYPIRYTELPDRNVVYFGAPRHAIQVIAEQSKSAPDLGVDRRERRSAVRVPIKCPSRYETHSEPKYIGLGQTIDISNAAIAFTTESPLPINAEATLHVTWPVRLQGEIPIELRAVGRLVRTESMKAALQLNRLNFFVAE